MKLKKAEDMAKNLGITIETFLDWREHGMPYVKIGRSIFVFEDSFLRWAKDHEITPPGQRPLWVGDPNAQDAPEQDFFGQSIGKVIPPKS
jgi:hypothetical protein